MVGDHDLENKPLRKDRARGKHRPQESEQIRDAQRKQELPCPGCEGWEKTEDPGKTSPVH